MLVFYWSYMFYIGLFRLHIGCYKFLYRFLLVLYRFDIGCIYVLGVFMDFQALQLGH